MSRYIVCVKVELSTWLPVEEASSEEDALAQMQERCDNQAWTDLCGMDMWSEESLNAEEAEESD